MGPNIRDREMEEFKSFIEDMELIDMPCIGGRFTWYNSNETAMSRFDNVSIANIVKDRIKVSVELWNNFEMKEIMLRLKSGHVWLREWDYNSRFFHNSLKNRYMRNFIKMVESSSGILEGVTEVKTKVKNYFESFFKDSYFNRPVPEGCLYKILAKILDLRLKRVIGKLISNKQSKFVPGRNISDGVLVVKEVLGLAKREDMSCLVLKVDYEKAYDIVSWNFLRLLFNKMGFGAKWTKWMKACVFNNSMLMLVNGSVTMDFKVGICLIQGDPLYLFHVCNSHGRPHMLNEKRSGVRGI
ncbi:uncharacterized protein LOC127096474 [Lathyrus oleraceus]|uniref:uncharacterized protein LOC127096474 n=1 Tax=Pisum sativum TaxID=3888 RepID=UPI0021D3466A|nr:uncharacterized protein LOC127096474 [Pisum sativum]